MKLQLCKIKTVLKYISIKMKNLIPLLGFFIIIISFTSCKNDQHLKAEMVTNNYVRFIDSVTNLGTSNAIKDWNNIEKDFDKKSNELNTEIDKLEDITIFDKKINPATAKYEAFRSKTFEQKLKEEEQEKNPQ